MKIRYPIKLILVSVFIVWGLAISPQSYANETYSVRNVAKNDGLNLRKFPSPRSKILATIPADASTIRISKKEVYRGASTWIEVQWQGKKGWVNSRYLTQVSVTSNKAKTVGSNQHTHPRNECTRSISHTHPNGNKPHVHRYSCKKSARVSSVDKNAHTHPRNKCTRSITHSHPNGNKTHKHHYSCKGNKKVEAKKKPVIKDPNAHTHPRNKCTRSITHSHPNGKRTHTHHYSCKAAKGRMKTDPNAHTHPRKKCTRSVTHTHPNGKRKHSHRYSCK